MRLGLIAARGGSKRIARKNIRRFHGRPMLCYSIDSALQSASIDRLWVSSDDDEIMAIARRSGAETPFRRPAHLADDHTPLQAVVAHALTYAEEQKLNVSAVCLLFATAPMLRSEDIEAGYAALIDRQSDYALSVTEFAFAPQRAQYIDATGELRYREPDYRTTRSQDLVTCYHEAGQFVWGTREAFLANRSDARTVPVQIPGDRVVDIDTPADWHKAEHIYASLMNNRMADGRQLA